MILKGLYNTKIDRMKTDQYKSYMFIKMKWIDETTLTDFEYLHLCSALLKISRVHDLLTDRATIVKECDTI